MSALPNYLNAQVFYLLPYKSQTSAKESRKEVRDCESICDQKGQ